VLLDEPAAGMNPAEAAELVRLIRELRDRLGLTIVLIEHHMHVVMVACDIVAVLDRGRVIALGTPREIQTNESVVDAYLGRRHKVIEADSRPELEVS
jgi:branched-chain amino acid transport system ATP-binding protein